MRVKYDVNVGDGHGMGEVVISPTATDDEIRLAILNDLYDVTYQKIFDTDELPDPDYWESSGVYLQAEQCTSGVIWNENDINNNLTSYTTAACTKGKWANGAEKTCQFCIYYFEGKGCQNPETYTIDCSWK